MPQFEMKDLTDSKTAKYYANLTEESQTEQEINELIEEIWEDFEQKQNIKKSQLEYQIKD